VRINFAENECEGWNRTTVQRVNHEKAMKFVVHMAYFEVLRKNHFFSGYKHYEDGSFKPSRNVPGLYR
jgi:hypothetical protein